MAAGIPMLEMPLVSVLRRLHGFRMNRMATSLADQRLMLINLRSITRTGEPPTPGLSLHARIFFDVSHTLPPSLYVGIT